MKCPNCGALVVDGANHCGNCGYNVNQSINQNVQANQYSNVAGIPTMEERNIALCIILSMVTCGIYGLYWFAKMTDDSNSLSKTKTASGVMAIILTLVTCGIYSIYWNYQMGKKMFEAGQTYGKDIKDNSVLYLILGILGLSIVNECLIQSDLNRFASK